MHRKKCSILQELAVVAESNYDGGKKGKLVRRTFQDTPWNPEAHLPRETCQSILMKTDGLGNE